MITLTVEPTIVQPPNCAIWEIRTDEPAADAWWVGNDEGVEIESHVPGWNDPYYWIANYCYDPNDPRWRDQDWHAFRAVVLYAADGTQIGISNTVAITIRAALAPPQPEPPSPGAPPPAPPGGAPVSPIPPLTPPSTGIPPVDAILEQITRALNDIIGRLNEIAGGIGGAIGERLAGLLPTALDVLAGANSALAEFVGTLGNALTPTDELWGLLFSTLRENWDSGSELVGDLAGNVLVAAARAFLTSLELERPGFWGPLLSTIRDTEGVPGEIREMAAEIVPGESPIAALLLIPIGIGLLGAVASGGAAGWLTQIQQTSLRATTPMPLPLSDATSGVVQSILDVDYAASEAASSGINRERFDQMVEIAGVPPGPETVLTMLNRGIIDESAARQAIIESPLKLKYTDAVLDMRFGLPSQSDLVRFLVREVFDADARAALSLDADYPDGADLEFQKLGVGPDLARDYWAAHWDLPSPTQGYQMLHRGVIDEQQLAGLLRAADYAPVWRDRLQAISFHPLTRVDVRRMHKVGVLTADELVRAYMDLGYTEENATRLRDFTVALNSGEQRAAIEPFRGSLRGRVIGAYIDGVFDTGEVTEALAGLLYTPEQIDAFVAEADLVREVEASKITAAGVKQRYVAGQIDETAAAISLVEAGFADDAAVRLVAAWVPAREYREQTDAERQARDLTKAEILTAVDEQLVAEGEARGMLLDLGYDARETETLLALAEHKRRRAEINDIRETVHLLYVAGRITRLDAGSRLDAAAIPATNKELLLTRWDAERERKVGALPLATIRDMREQSVLTAEQVVQELRLHSLTDGQISALIRLWSAGKEA